MGHSRGATAPASWPSPQLTQRSNPATARVASPHTAHALWPPPRSANEKLMLERLVIKKGAFLDVSGGDVSAARHSTAQHRA